MSKMRLSYKLTASFASILLLLIIITFVYQWLVSSTTSSYNELIKHEVAMANYAQKIEAKMLQARRNEKDFLLRLNLKYLGKHEKTMTALKAEAEGLRKLAVEAENNQFEQDAKLITQYANNYQNSFKEIVESWKHKGLTHKDGLQGHFRKTVKTLEKEMSGYKNAGDVYFTYLMLRRYEKDYVRTNRDKYKKRFIDWADRLQKGITKGKFTPEITSSLQTGAKQYQKWGAKIIRDNNYTGYFETKSFKDSYAGIRKAAHDIEDVLKKIWIPGITEELLMLRRAEKDYLLRSEAKYIGKVDKLISKLKGMYAKNGLDKDLVDTAIPMLNEYLKSFNQLVAENGKIKDLTAQMRSAVHQIEPIVAKVASTSNKRVKDISLATTNNADKWGNTVVIIAIIIIFLAIGLVYILVQSINKPIMSLVDKLNAGAQQLKGASQQISSSSQQLAEGANEQAASIEETMASLSELSSTTENNAKNAREANTLADESAGEAQRGRDAMGNMEQAINQIKASSDETERIIKTIDEIAFQTNLLALNAAVEAARAGDAGKGFAVVAEEVRNLAQRSAHASKNTSELIQEVRANSENGVAVTNSVSKILSTIVSKVDSLKGIINEVSASSDEQARGISDITAAVGQMDKVTQLNASNSEETAASSEELSSQATEQEREVQVLNEMIRGEDAANNMTDGPIELKVHSSED